MLPRRGIAILLTKLFPTPSEPFRIAPGVCSSDQKRTGDSMRSSRRFVYSAVLALSALTFTPIPASAQQMHGSFTLSHQVRWQKCVVPAGDYRFEVQPKGPSALLLLRKVSGHSAGFLILANNAESSKPSDLDRLVVVARPSGSYVSSME